MLLLLLQFKVHIVAITYYFKKLLKYIVHGSHFVQYIFSNNMLQMDLKSHLRFKRYHIF